MIISFDIWPSPTWSITHFNGVKAIAHRVRNFRMRFSVFSYSSSFPIKIHATDEKTQKIEPDPKKLTDESFGGSVQT